MSREAFEKIQHIKDHLEHFDIYYSSLGGYRYSKDTTPCFYLNGAWMMYQEQQKKIEDLKTVFEEYELESSYHSPDYKKLEMLSVRIKEIVG